MLVHEYLWKASVGGDYIGVKEKKEETWKRNSKIWNKFKNQKLMSEVRNKQESGVIYLVGDTQFPLRSCDSNATPIILHKDVAISIRKLF